MVRWGIILIGVFLLGIIFSGGCVTVNVGKESGAIPTTIADIPPTIIPTTSPLWTMVIDNNYILAASGNGLNQVDIPIMGNSAYRLKLDGGKRLTLRTESKVIAAGVVNYNGIFKTGSSEKNLHVEWIYFSNEPGVLGSSQNVRVQLERYNGDPSVFPDTTNAPESYRQYV